MPLSDGSGTVESVGTEAALAALAGAAFGLSCHRKAGGSLSAGWSKNLEGEIKGRRVKAIPRSWS
jgi:hypothetical protein